MSELIYPTRTRIPNILLFNGDYRDYIDYAKKIENVIVVTDPPFNINYHYGKYKDNMKDTDYYSMLSEIVKNFPSVIIHYPESLHRITYESGIVPTRVVSWVYNSNTAKQHRDIAFYNVNPIFTNAKQEYKNLNDKRIKERIARGLRGGRMYDWWNVNQVKNVSKDKTSHPCQMPLEIMKNIVSTLPNNSTIFDCFMGSGTTGVACYELGYDFIGTEIDADYFDIADKRINERQISIFDLERSEC